MTPLVILLVATVVCLAAIAGMKGASNWHDATRCGLALMFVFTGVTHFSSIKHDYAAMVPPPFTGQLWVIYLTGVLEITGGIGLLLRKVRRLAGICLSLLLLALFPANVYAAVNAIQFRDSPPTDIWLRALVQLVLLGALWWSTMSVRRE